jgi:glucan phosphoethanolaminetransferase (alkaline phosphatase superfamily)
VRFLYLTIQFMPYWTIPLALIFAEVALIFRRRGYRKRMMRMALVSGFFIVLSICFFVFRWEKTLYPWLRDALQ